MIAGLRIDRGHPETDGLAALVAALQNAVLGIAGAPENRQVAEDDQVTAGHVAAGRLGGRWRLLRPSVRRREHETGDNDQGTQSKRECSAHAEAPLLHAGCEILPHSRSGYTRMFPPTRKW